MVLAVDPEHLRHAADEVRQAAFDVDELLIRPLSRLGVPGQRTWESAGCLQTAVKAWGEHLARLAADPQVVAVVTAGCGACVIEASGSLALPVIALTGEEAVAAPAAAKKTRKRKNRRVSFLSEARC